MRTEQLMATPRCRLCRAILDTFTVQVYPGAKMCISCLHDSDDIDHTDGVVRIIERLSKRVAELEQRIEVAK